MKKHMSLLLCLVLITFLAGCGIDTTTHSLTVSESLALTGTETNGFTLYTPGDTSKRSVYVGGLPASQGFVTAANIYSYGSDPSGLLELFDSYAQAVKSADIEYEIEKIFHCDDSFLIMSRDKSDAGIVAFEKVDYELRRIWKRTLVSEKNIYACYDICSFGNENYALLITYGDEIDKCYLVYTDDYINTVSSTPIGYITEQTRWSLSHTPDGGFVVAGTQSGSRKIDGMIDCGLEQLGYNGFTAMFDSSGEVSWIKGFGEKLDDCAENVYFDTDSGIIYTVYNSKSDLEKTAKLLATYDTDGKILDTQLLTDELENLADTVIAKINNKIIVILRSDANALSRYDVTEIGEGTTGYDISETPYTLISPADTKAAAFRNRFTRDFLNPIITSEGQCVFPFTIRVSPDSALSYQNDTRAFFVYK